jgi:hypothetical protein
MSVSAAPILMVGVRMGDQDRPSYALAWGFGRDTVTLASADSP